MNFGRFLPVLAVAALSVGLAQCSSSGGSVAPTPTASPISSPGAITFSGPSIVNNVMTLPCNTPETFMISQANYGGTFTLTNNNPNQLNTLMPTSGTSATTFTAQSVNGSNAVFTVTAAGASGTSGILTINFTTGMFCG